MAGPENAPAEIFTEAHRAVRFGMRHRHVDPEALGTGAVRSGRAALVKLGAAKTKLAHSDRSRTGRAHRPPTMGDGADGGVSRAQGQRRARAHLRCREQRRRNRNLRHVVPGLRVEQGDRANGKPCVLENPAPDRHVGLRLGEVAAVDIHARLVAQRRDRHGKRDGGRLVRDPRGIDGHLREVESVLRKPRGGQHGAEQETHTFHRLHA